MTHVGLGALTYPRWRCCCCCCRSSTMAGVDKKLAQVHARIEKHMRGSSPYLIGVVWGK